MTPAPGSVMTVSVGWGMVYVATAAVGDGRGVADKRDGRPQPPSSIPAMRLASQNAERFDMTVSFI